MFCVLVLILPRRYGDSWREADAHDEEESHGEVIAKAASLCRRRLSQGWVDFVM